MNVFVECYVPHLCSVPPPSPHTLFSLSRPLTGTPTTSSHSHSFLSSFSGYPAAAIRLFCERMGVSKSENNIDMSVLEDCVRDTLGELVREESMGNMKNRNR